MIPLLSVIPKLPFPGGDNPYVVLGAGGVSVLLVGFVILKLFSRGGKKHDPEANLGEDLSTIPAPPKGERHYQLLVMNIPVRLRLVVVAPMGKKTVGKVDSALEQVFRGLGEVAVDDKPRVRIWPAQLSAAGFAPTFFRLTKKPEPDGKPSRWILLAGPARAGSMPVLLAMAVQADTPNKHGLITLTETQWNEVLGVENA